MHEDVASLLSGRDTSHALVTPRLTERGSSLMPDANLDSTQSAANRTLILTLDDAKAWVDAMSERGMYDPNSARVRATAITRLTSVLSDDEPRIALWVLEHIDEIGQRWARKNNGNSLTTRTYVSRAKTALTDFLKYQTDPMSFKGKSRSAAAKPQRDKKAAGLENAKPGGLITQVTPIFSESAAPASTCGVAQKSTTSQELRTFPLDANAGRIFRYALPDDGVVHFREVARIFCHLISFADDFDPTNPVHADFYFKALTAVNRAPEDAQRQS